MTIAAHLIFCRVQPHGQIRTATYQGQPHLVAPVVALVAGVVNGHLATAEEITTSLRQWNGVPLVVNHPQDTHGAHISANESPVVAEQVMGRLWNCTFTQGRLRGELWINLPVAESIGGEVWDAVQRLQAGQALEVSTGFFAQTEEQAGTHQGRAYEGIYRDIRPDHLALLPNAIGACSWADGCGTPRVQAQEMPGVLVRVAHALQELVTLGRQGAGRVSAEDPWPDPPEKTSPATVSAEGALRPSQNLQTQRTDQDIRTALYDLLAQEMGVTVTPIVIQFLDPEERAFVYRIGERVLMRRYTVGDDGAIGLAPEVQSVQLDTRLIPVGETMAPSDLPQNSPWSLVRGPLQGTRDQGPGTMDHGQPAQPGDKGHRTMDKGQAITTILTNLHLEGAEQRAALEALDGAVLTTFATVTGAIPTPQPPAPLPPVMTMQDAMQRLGVAPSSPVYATLDAAVKTYEAQRTALIAALVGSQCPLAREVLNAAPLETLEHYRSMMQLPVPGAPVPSYLGQGAASPVQAQETLEGWRPKPVTLAKVAS